jgi:hypothetical protein
MLRSRHQARPAASPTWQQQRSSSSGSSSSGVTHHILNGNGGFTLLYLGDLSRHFMQVCDFVDGGTMTVQHACSYWHALHGTVSCAVLDKALLMLQQYTSQTANTL